MRVIICVQHHRLMEPLSPESDYVVCSECKSLRRDPSWFPRAYANINHKDGSMKRTWVWVYSVWTTSNGKWEREK